MAASSSSPSDADFSFIKDPAMAKAAADAFAVIRAKGSSPEAFDLLMQNHDEFSGDHFIAFVAVLLLDAHPESKLPDSLRLQGPSGTFVPGSTYMSLAHRSVSPSLVLNLILMAPANSKTLAFSLAAPRGGPDSGASKTEHLSPQFMGFEPGLSGFLQFINGLREPSTR